MIKSAKTSIMGPLFAAALVLLGAASGRSAAPDAVRVFEEKGAAVIENAAVRVEFDLERGTCRARTAAG